MMMSIEDHRVDRDDAGPASAVRVRITGGPDDSVIGRIGYLFDFYREEYKGYILTVAGSEVRRLHLQDGYGYQIEEI
jgi:hypothetical protein